MFEPISARLASSFSRNGISAAATETSCFGDTSISVDVVSRGPAWKSPALRVETSSFSKVPSVVRSCVGLGNGVAHLLGRGQVLTTSSVTLPSFTLR